MLHISSYAFEQNLQASCLTITNVLDYSVQKVFNKKTVAIIISDLSIIHKISYLSGIYSWSCLALSLITLVIIA